MSTEPKRKSLGMGLSALFNETGRDADPDLPQHMASVAALRPGKYQPRRQFEPESLAALAQSIREKGIIQPLLVRRHPSEADCFEIIAGERRWRAAQQAQLHEVPVIVRALSDRDAAEISLIENLQREDLNPLEEAQAYKRLVTEFERTHEELAQVLGKSRSHVGNVMRLLESTPKIQALVGAGTLSAGHARALLNAADADRMADEVATRGLTVRQLEARIKPKRPDRAKPAPPPIDTTRAAADLTMRWGMKVVIKDRPVGPGGLLILRYETLDELEGFIRRVK